MCGSYLDAVADGVLSVLTASPATLEEREAMAAQGAERTCDSGLLKKNPVAATIPPSKLLQPCLSEFNGARLHSRSCD